jgi:hypothetical protein
LAPRPAQTMAPMSQPLRSLVLIGEFFIFPNWISLIYLVAAAWLFHRQVLREEQYLGGHYGQAYAEYVEFRTSDGESLAISVPKGETAVLQRFQAQMPYGLFVPDVP